MAQCRRKTTSGEELLRLLDDWKAPEPSGFIFHATRSGSTLISQMLATDSDHLVISEPAAPAVALWAKERLNFAEKIAYFSAVMRAYSRSMCEGETRFFVKFGIAVGWLKWIRVAFPRTPCLFVYRSPREIVASNLRERPLWLRGVENQRELFTQTLSMKFDFVTAAMETGPEGLTLINYKDINQNFPSALRSILNLPADDAKSLQMGNALQWYSKKKSQVWNEEFAARKPIEVPDGPDLVELDRKYQRLEELRLLNGNNKKSLFPNSPALHSP